MADRETKLWEGVSRSVEATVAVGRAIGAAARAGDLIALVGELGAGKTQLVRGLAEGMNVEQAAVASPTFVMVQEYPGRTGEMVLVHIDAYRLTSLEDLESIGWSEEGGEMRRGAVVALEWADRVAGFVGEDALEVRLGHAGQTERSVEIRGRGGGSWEKRWTALTRALDAAVGGLGRVTAKCPTCGKPVEKGSRFEPFCSERCKLVDLNKWMKGDYKISRPVEQKDLEEG